MKNLIFLIIAFSFVFHLKAQSNITPSPIIFIYDASGSMMGKIQGKTKMEIASGVLTNSVNSLPGNQHVGLVAYGHRSKDDCKDVEFLVDVNGGTKSQVNQSLKTIKPLGKTPLAYSATQVINKLRDGKSKATIILITDGIESCDGDICKVVAAARKEGIDFRLHIVGFGLKSGETEQLRCAAKAGDGQYYDAMDAGRLGEVLNEATASPIDKPSKNFSVYALKNGKPIDALVKAFKPGSKTATVSARTYADTGFMYLPAGAYNLEVTPLENSDVKSVMVDNVKSSDNKITHQTVSFDAAKLQISTQNNGEGWDAVVKIYEKGNKKVVASGRTYGKQPAYEINPGSYDVELTALVMEGLDKTYVIKDVSIKPGETKNLEHNFKTGIAMIGVKDGSGLVDAGVSIKESKTKTNIISRRTYTTPGSNPKEFILNPGTYEVTTTALGSYKGKKQTFTVVVKEGETVEKMVNY